MLFYQVEKNKYLKRKVKTSFHISPPDATNEVKPDKRAPYVTLVHRGSLTVEAALVLPFFIAAVTTLIFLIQAIQIQVQIQKALYNQTMKVTGYGYYINSVDLATEAESLLEVGYIKLKIIEELGEDFFESNAIVNGKKGFVLYLTNVSKEGLVDVALLYSLRVPFDIFNVGKLDFVARARCATWIGASPGTTEWDVNMVYMTAHGEVYHCDRECTYIKSDISECRLDEIEAIRNASGGKYYPCTICDDRREYDSKQVFYTKYGTRYHLSEYCSNLKSNVFAIEEVVAKEKYKACSKCCGKGEKYD